MNKPQDNANPAGAAESLSDVRTRLFRAIVIVAGPPQAQRRTVQLGSFQHAVATVLRDGARAVELREHNLLPGQQAELIEELRRRLSALRDSRDDYLEEANAAPREFLWSHALEDEEWSAARHLARSCFTLMKAQSHEGRG